jgi:hypothetical protein
MNPQEQRRADIYIPRTPTLLGGGQIGTRQEVVTLDEGDVVITFPENLSVQSYEDLKDHLDLFIKKMQRRAVPIPPHIVTGETPPKTLMTEDEGTQIPFMITKAQKQTLREMGYDDAAISKMTPEQAHKALGIMG